MRLKRNFGTRVTGLFLGLLTSCAACAADSAAAISAASDRPISTTSVGPGSADYKVTFVSLSPLKIRVSAKVRVDGKMLAMVNSYPADLPEMAAKGWPALITNLVVCDAAGSRLPVTAVGPKGWQLPDSMRTGLTLTYEVDYSLLAASGWSSALESAFVDDNDAIVAGRSVFITGATIGTINVQIITPKGWNPIVPWTGDKGGGHHYRVRSREDLVDNLLVMSTRKPDVVTAAGFRMQIISLGHWQPLRPLVRQTLKTIINREVSLMHYREKEIYNIVLLPISDEGGNAFRQSFVYCYDQPGYNNRDIWGNTLAHEIFHYWNYSRLKGADYASSQWFQEGFTEYVANQVMVTGRLIDSNTFVGKLSTHVNNYRKLTTTLENYGTHKGPPLYSAGALVAFMWDVKIRQATGGKRDLGDFFRNLMVQTDSGARKYSWNDIKAALQATADGDWERFYQSHIRGHEPLPLAAILPLAGLRLDKLADGSERVGINPGASAEAKTLFQRLVGD